MPTYSRPKRLDELRQAIGGWPDFTLVLNTDDPLLDQYPLATTSHVMLPAGSRCCDAHRAISRMFPNEDFYGLLSDDIWPITPGWWRRMEEAAGNKFMSVCNDNHSFPLCARSVICLGGDLVRAAGTIMPPPIKHNYGDNFWDDVAARFDLLKTLPDVYVEHHHWTKGSMPPDLTYARGSADIDEDGKIYQEWMKSMTAAECYQRIAAMLAQ